MKPENLKRARIDVDSATIAWTKIISEHLDNVEFAYLKGSATKYWQSPIDYVPILSDLDIHIKTIGNKPLFPSTKQGFMDSLEVTTLYEYLFTELNPDYMHIPRPQIVTINELNPLWIPSDTSEFKGLYGEVQLRIDQSPEEIRYQDYQELKAFGPVLSKLPMRLIDKIGVDYYQIIREICWRVSPSPYRLLSQTEDPEYIWSLNRTQVHRELENMSYQDTAKYYWDFYILGWKMFETWFKDNQVMRDVIKNGFNVMDSVYTHLKESKQ